MKLKEGIYLVYVNASAGNGPITSDILLFHIDPPQENESSLLTTLPYYVTAASLVSETIAGIFLIRRQRRLQITFK